MSKEREEFFRSKNMESRMDNPRRAGASWSSIFAGTFVFLAIETTFGLLAAAIFPSMRTAGTLATGPGIWMIILSIIALYFGAKTASHLSGEARKLDGMYHGLVTFGMSIFSSLLIATMILGNTAAAETTLPKVLTANAVWLFVTFILGGIAAGIGGSYGVQTTKSSAVGEPVSMRPAA
jgi:fumarate reductase subunit D